LQVFHARLFERGKSGDLRIAQDGGDEKKLRSERQTRGMLNLGFGHYALGR
jgi:hypothetical protein